LYILIINVENSFYTSLAVIKDHQILNLILSIFENGLLHWCIDCQTNLHFYVVDLC
jgi:hypothetical protein